MASIATMPADDGPEDADLYDMARELMDRATQARNKGDAHTSQRLLKAAMQVLDEEPAVLPTKGRQASPALTKLVDMLREGWQEVDTIQQATGLSVNRIHSALSRLRQQGINVQTQAIKRYRISGKAE